MESLLLFQTSFPAKELFTLESLTTLVGLTGMVYAGSNTIQRAFNYNPKWLALVIAQVLTLIAVSVAFEKPGFIDYLIGVFNGCLVYLSAAGTTNVGDRLTGGQGEEEAISAQRATRGFTTSWW